MRSHLATPLLALLLIAGVTAPVALAQAPAPHVVADNNNNNDDLGGFLRDLFEGNGRNRRDRDDRAQENCGARGGVCKSQGGTAWSCGADRRPCYNRADECACR